MSAQRQDSLLRVLDAANGALQRMRTRLAERAAPEQIVAEARAAQRELLGTDATVIRALDPESAARLLADPRRVALWAELLRVEADALRAAGHESQADALDRRVTAITS